MDNVFTFSEAARLDFLQSAFHSYGCVYICLWSYISSSSNRLMFYMTYKAIRQVLLGGVALIVGFLANIGVWNLMSLLITTSLKNHLASSFISRVPGLAFWNQYSYLELQQSDLLRLAWTDIQRKFFQEARIETAVFIGCRNGEIELGFSSVSQGTEIQTDFQNWFPEDFSGQSHHQVEQKIPPSLSSDQHTSLVFRNIFPSSSLLPEMLLQQENELEEGMNKAILHHVISSSPSSNNSTLSSSVLKQDPPNDVFPERVSAFKRYRPPQMGRYKPNLRRQSLLKRSFELLQGLHFMRTREHYEASNQTSNQFLHMLSERRRRDKLNRNFQALRSLLPPETKKDKASILIAAKETLSSLMVEIEKMAKKEDKQVVMMKAKMKEKELLTKRSSSTSDERYLSVRVSDVEGSSSSSVEKSTDLHVTTVRRQGHFLQVDILSPLLEFLKKVQGVTLISVDATTHIAQGNSIDEVTLRLKIKGSEWDVTAFKVAVRRVVADLAG